MWRVLLMVLCLWLPLPGLAAPGDVVVHRGALAPAAQRAAAKSGVVVLGPATVSPELRATKGSIHLFVSAATFGGQAGAVELYLLLSNRKGRPGQPPRLDRSNYVGSFAAMHDGSREPGLVGLEVNDFAVKGKQYRPRTRLKKARQVWVAVVGDVDRLQFTGLELSTETMAERQTVQPSQPPCDAHLLHKWELSKVAENCMAQRACVVDKRLADVACGGQPGAKMCMTQCLQKGLTLISQSVQTAPPQSAACVECLGSAYEAYVAECGAVCPACPDDASAHATCKDCQKRGGFFRACLPAR